MKTELQKKLASIAPFIHIETIWSHDPDHTDIRKDCDGFDDEDPEDWQAWESEIRATAIIEGEEITGSEYLGATWEKWDSEPAISNPEISGYEPQMTVEALEELYKKISITAPGAQEIAKQITAAIEHIKAKMEADYNEQMASR